MRFITRSNQPVAPATVMSSAHTMKAPTASPRLWPAPAVASTAAPGVLQAIITGFGLKLGADIYKYFKEKVGIFPEDSDNAVLQDGAPQAD